MSSNLTISFELIFLMGWLLNNEKAKLKKLVKSAVDNGFAHELEHMDPEEQNKAVDQLNETVLDFLLFLEEALLEHLDTVDLDLQSKEKLTPALKKFDLQNIDIKTLWLSLQQVKTQLNRANKKAASVSQQDLEVQPGKKLDPNDMLYKTLLKNWNPENKEPVN